MDPSEKKWFTVLLKNVHERFDEKSSIVLKLFSKYKTQEEFIHFYIHSSGLFYGYVSRHLLCKFESTKSWSYADHYKVSLTEGLFLAYLYNQKHRLIDKHRVPELINEAMQKIYEFYIVYTIDESYFKKKKTFFSRLEKQNDVDNTLEKLLDHRVNNPSMLTKGFWKGSTYNVFSYLDILFFASWLDGYYLFDKKKEIKKEILKTMIAASFSSISQDRKDKLLVSFFIASANIGSELEKEFESDINNKISLDDISYNNELPRLIRYLVFEHAVVTLLSDSIIDELEEEFINKLTRILDLDEDEKQYSSMVVENFISNNTKHILFLQHRFGFEFITNSFSRRFSTFFNKNSTKIINELSESKELMGLLWKAKNEKLSDEEREKVKDQIQDILRTIPSLTIFMIPGGSLLLPLLLKIIPEELMKPSSFRNK